jgi:hypothetical protein
MKNFMKNYPKQSGLSIDLLLLSSLKPLKPVLMAYREPSFATLPMCSGALKLNKKI